MREVDRVAELQPIRRIGCDGTSSIRHGDRTSELDDGTGRRELANARLMNEVNERRRASVHDRHFGAIELYDHVVDAERAKRG